LSVVAGTAAIASVTVKHDAVPELATALSYRVLLKVATLGT
jgi:hypothetical protein